MDLLLSMNMHCNGVPPGSRGDLVNLVSYLNQAEEIATSSPVTFKARTMIYHSRDTSSSLEPTPIRPDHEMFLRKQNSFVMHNEKEPSQQKPMETGSSFSNVFATMDETLDLDEAILAPMVIELFNKHHASTSSKDRFSIGKRASSPGTIIHGSSAPIRLHNYQTSQWDIRFQELIAFHQEHGHLLVPHSFPPNPKLAQWVKRQRHQYKRKHTGHHSTLTDEREEKLSAVVSFLTLTVLYGAHALRLSRPSFWPMDIVGYLPTLKMVP
ncbi:helicase domain protein [Nitzschia inconspicua]|uniref:Helicase domain protein n=1 Tax=Nitzschia inconspicua TaxID=303405 RepID=A0A9K3M4G5_9STRA|nr:helicase domain protein [Nitzschia inconspicua]